MPTLAVENAVLNYEQWGDETAPPVVLVNGHLRPLNDFRSLGKQLTQQGWRVVAFDNRGAGLTRYEGAFDLATMVSDLDHIVKRVASECCPVLGISMGGMLAMEYAAEQPAFLKSLVLVSTAAHHRHFHLPVKIWPAAEDDILEVLRSYVAPRFFESNQVLLRSMAKQMAKSFKDADKSQGAALQRQVTSEFDCVAKLPLVSVPATVIHGSIDRVIAVEAAYELDAYLGECQVRILPEVGHLLLVEAFAQLATAVGEALTPSN